MTELRNLLTRTLDHAVAYRESVAADPKPLSVDYHSLRDRIAGPVPEQGGDPEAIIDELVGLADGALMPMTGSRFFGWVIGASDPVGVAADWLVTAWGQNAGYQTPTPAAAALEELAESWLLELLDLPAGSAIGFVTGATVANGTCLAAARTGVLLKAGWDPDADGLFGAPEVHVLLGDDAHSSVFSALQLVGFGYKRVIKVKTDGQGRIIPAALEAAIAPLSGPKIIIAQAGQINTGAYDPFDAIADIAKRHDAWLHVDGAFGLWARATPKRKPLTAGIERADSWCTDGHKWLQVPYDCGFAIVRDKEILLKAMTQWSTYLPSITQGDRVPSNYVPELSRRARGVPVWAVIKSYGRDGIAALVERHCSLAARFGERLGKEPGISVENDIVINQVIVRFGDDDAATKAVIERVQKDGVMFAGGAQWRGKWMMRLSVSSSPTTEADIDQSADAVIAAWRAVQASR